MRLGPAVLKQILAKPKLRRIEIRTDFFELDDKIESIFKNKDIQEVVRTAYIRAICELQKSVETILKVFKKHEHLRQHQPRLLNFIV